MKYGHLSEQYEILVNRIMEALEQEIMSSKIESKTHDINVINVDVCGYTEMGIINDNLTFLDDGGYHYGIWTNVDVNDLIDILNTL